MPKRSEYQKLKRKLDENIPRNIEACISALAPHVESYMEGSSSAILVAHDLLALIKTLELAKNHTKVVLSQLTQSKMNTALNDLDKQLDD